MINNTMKDYKQSNAERKPVQSTSPKPNELGGIQISTHLKISDPNTGKILVQKRGDI
jgi:hypothetical protein